MNESHKTTIQKNQSYELINFCEVDKYATKSYCAIHDVDPNLNLGDITKIDEKKLKPFTMICGGSPCFVSGTSILTSKGYKNIEDIDIGDRVLTHKNQFMPVVNIGGEKNKNIYSLKVQGALPIFCTDYHPFYVKTTRHSPPIKLPLKDIKKGYYLGSNINVNSNNLLGLSNELCWILGRYIADGHIRYGKRNNRKNSYQYQLVLSIGSDKIDYLKSKITSRHFSCYPHNTNTYRVVFASKELVDFIRDYNFGMSAVDKNIPQFIIDLPKDKLESFFDGYMSGDGCRIGNKYQATTISKKLAMAICQIVQKLYRVGCRIYYNKRPSKYYICGREVNQNDTYLIRFMKSNIKHSWFIDKDIIWYPVKNIEVTNRIENVYNIEVKQDHTYIANNIITYNCQDFSVAGKQNGSKWKCNECGHEYNPLTVHFSVRTKCPKCNSDNLDKTRSSLLVEWLRVIRVNKPKWGIYENVKNIIGKQFKSTFQMFLNELNEYDYNTYYKVLNAKDYGIPQNRERVFLIIIKKELDNGNFKFPKPFDNGLRLKDVLEDEVDDKYYINTPKAKELIQDLIESGKLDKQVSNTVRAGGRGSVDRHQWDIIQD